MTDIRFARASNRADLELVFRNTDPEDGSLIDLSPYDIRICIRRRGYCGTTLTATTDDGTVTFPGAGIVRVALPAARLRSLCPDLYEVGGTLSDGTETVQFVLGTLPIYDGIAC